MFRRSKGRVSEADTLTEYFCKTCSGWLEPVYYLRLLIADREPSEDEPEPPSMWVTLCSIFGDCANFFTDIYPCNFGADPENMQVLA